MRPPFFEPDPDDRALFRTQVGPVTPLDCGTIAPGLTRTRPKPRPRPKAPDSLATEAALHIQFTDGDDDPAWTVADTLSYRHDGVQRMVLHKLRRGRFTITTTLDLHGMTAATAAAILGEFLQRARREHMRCVRIVHGKGRGLEGPVLKGKLNGWLRQRDEVLAFCSARATDGGTGALYVLLRGHGRNTLQHIDDPR